MSQQGYKDSGRLSADILRKSSKPLLEKKRRARINKSLDQLKGLVLEALKKDSARYSKLEKADILEMTVKHLRELQRQQMAVAVSVDPTVLPKYRAGFNECAEEVKRYLSTIDGLSAEMRMRLMNHLANCVSHVNVVSPAYSPSVNMAYQQLPAATHVGSLPGYPYHPHVAYPELLPAELLARSTMAQSPVLSSSPDLSPSENHTISRDYYAEVSQFMTTTPPGEGRTNLQEPFSLMAQPQAQLRVIRPLCEQNNNTIYRQNSNVKGTENSSEIPCKAGMANNGLSQAAPCKGSGHVPVHLPLHVDVKQEPVWRPW